MLYMLVFYTVYDTYVNIVLTCHQPADEFYFAKNGLPESL